jgi:predicted transcriptional regulator
MGDGSPRALLAGVVDRTGGAMYTYTMHRTQMYLTDAEIARLDEIAAERGTTRSDLVRQAVAMAFGPMVSREERSSALRAAAGSWVEGPGEDRAAPLRAMKAAGAGKVRHLHGLDGEEPASDHAADRG